MKVIWAVTLVVVTWIATIAGAEPKQPNGDMVYDRYCSACHGSAGDGHGPAAPWLWPRPRDFTQGLYKWRSSNLIEPPTDDDLRATISYGVPGTSMHGFGASLSAAEIDAVLSVVKGFAPKQFVTLPTPIHLPEQPGGGPDLERGKQLFKTMGCVQCHGADGHGDGPQGKALKTADGLPAGPYDLRSQPLRRPRKDGQRPSAESTAAIFKTLTTGLAGTSMPSYAGLPESDRWMLAAYVDSIRFRGELRGNDTNIHAESQAADRRDKSTEAGYWAGRGSQEEMSIFGATIPLAPPAPKSLAPAQASLDARQCARCHNKQYREWSSTLHGGAASPGLIGQILRVEGRGASIESCQRCHAPLAEQLPLLRPGHLGGNDDARTYSANAAFDANLRKQGINCASCHIRQWQRLGPPMPANSKLLALPGYPRKALPIYERADFCQPCHQLPPRLAINGKPLLNTYVEWLKGPYMPRGVQCQHCHMPNREHTWKGIHDPETFRQGIRLDVLTGRSANGVVSVRAKVTNVGAGHYLPTTPTPAAWLSIELVDRDGDVIKGARAEKRIGRHIAFRPGSGFVELEDTRIPPGEFAELTAGWRAGRVQDASHVRVRIRVSPDDYYEGLYKNRLKANISVESRRMFEQALQTAVKNRYQAVERLIPIETRTR